MLATDFTAQKRIVSRQKIMWYGWYIGLMKGTQSKTLLEWKTFLSFVKPCFLPRAIRVPSCFTSTTTSLTIQIEGRLILYYYILTCLWFQLLFSSHIVALSWISVVGCLLSLVGIIISVFVTVCFRKNLHSQRTVVLINLCVAIAMTDVLVVAMEIADVQNQVSVVETCSFL